MDDNFNNCQRFDIQVSTDPEEASLIVLTESKEKEETTEDLPPGFYLNGVLIEDDDELQD